MKKLDLHIHTIPTISDSPFSFSMNKLKEYVKALSIDGIAITNHNQFDIDQYREIQSELSDRCVTLPGVEISVGSNGFGHLICITNEYDVEDFKIRCDHLASMYRTQTDKISLTELKRVFADLSKYLWIPHYDKKPSLDRRIISEMGENVLCGETGSVKKFIYCKKNNESLVPVLFSDLRPTDELEGFPSRQTYFDIDEITVEAIKKTLICRNHVSLSETEGNDLFYALPDLPISTGLNVIIGERSSGKTYTLNQISKHNENTKYIQQFQLIEKDPEKAAKDFTDRIATKRSSFAEEYFEPFKDAVDIVKNISLKEDEKNIEKYITSLVRFANESDRADMFAKCTLFGESKYPKRKFDNIEKIIDAVELLLDAKGLQDIIEKHINREDLIKLHISLIEQYRREKRRSLEEEWVNDVVSKVKRQLKIKTATTDIPDIDFYECQMNRVKVRAFNELANTLKEERVINNQELEDFVIQTKKRPFNSALELKNYSGKKNVSFSKSINEYTNNPYQYLLGLKDMNDIPETDYYKYFAFVDYQILNKYGYPVSGGERAEFRLLQEIHDAYRYDMLIIDEPESSFDNLFLRDKVNHIIKELSDSMPVILATHNNTVGASIKPDYLIYTKRIVDEEVRYERYYGLPSSKELSSFNGKSIKNIKAVLDCLEAGENAYDERKRDYELLKD